MDMKSKRLFK